MASLLKRKRAVGDISATPKRTKVVEHGQLQSGTPRSAKSTVNVRSPLPDLSRSGWDAAFGSPTLARELAVVAGPNGRSSTRRGSDSSEAEDYDTFNENAKRKHSGSTPSRSNLDVAEVSLDSTTTDVSQPGWKVSDSIGGRMLDLDPIFVNDEKFLIVAQRRSLRVYSTSNSLLNRIINLEVTEVAQPSDRIVAFTLSVTDSNMIWVAYSNGAIYRIDWTTGVGADNFWSTSSTGVIYMAAASLESAGRIRDVVFTSEQRDDGGWRIQAHELTAANSDIPTVSRTIYTSTQEIQALKASDDGSTIIASSGNRILLGQLRSSDFNTVDKIKYVFRVFESSDPISSMDLRVSARPIPVGSKASKVAKTPVVDAVIGDVRGAIFVHNDLLSNLILAEADQVEGQPTVNLIPRKLHWHRKAVHTVKWSRDGNYIISGGSETVLVLWQLDTGKHQFLPHMTASIQNVVVSPVGSSYAIRLADNSTMVLSTSELKPTANISGIQAHVIKGSKGIEGLVQRVAEERPQRALMERTPALINPANPAQLLLAVGDTQEIDPSFALKSSLPYLQTFDISSSHNISRQALTRTNVTGRLIAPNAHKIEEARIVHMQSSYDGKWLATVDEWLPPKRDVAFLQHGGMDLVDEQRRRREVYLKFWKWSDAQQIWELVSRVDAPHTLSYETHGAGHVLALTAGPRSTSFTTLGEDGAIRIWTPRTRKRENIVVRGKDGEPLVDWKCLHSVSMGEVDMPEDSSSRPRPEHGCLAFADDGSILAAALSGTEENVIYLIDPSSGKVRSARPAMYRGDVIDIAFLAQYLIILADELQVYDLVTEELKYKVALGQFRCLMSLEQKAHMMHLAVDRESRTFAVALPTSSLNPAWLKQQKGERRFLEAANTEVAVFDPEHATPLITHTLPAFATALLPAIGSQGYIILDAAAEITPILPKAVQTLTSTALPMTNMGLDNLPDEVAERGLTDILDDEVEDEAMEVLESADMDMEDVNDDGPKVVSQQQLTNIFDNGPAFAMPPIEEMFYQVAGLFSHKVQQQAV